MTDMFRTHARTLTSPPEHAAAITPVDEPLAACDPRALCRHGRRLAVKMAGGAVVTLANVPSGSLLPIRVERVLAPGTTASQILGLW